MSALLQTVPANHTSRKRALILCIPVGWDGWVGADWFEPTLEPLSPQRKRPPFGIQSPMSPLSHNGVA